MFLSQVQKVSPSPEGKGGTGITSWREGKDRYREVVVHGPVGPKFGSNVKRDRYTVVCTVQ